MMSIILITSFLLGGILYFTFAVKGFKSVLLPYDDQLMDRFLTAYIPTHLRCSTWLMGSVFGYIMFELRDNKIYLPKIAVIAGWILSIGNLFAIVLGPLQTIVLETTTSSVEAASYEFFSRYTWSISLGWIIFGCHQGYGGWINSFLSHPLWQPLSRISFAMYLCHVTVLTIIYGNLQTSIYFSQFALVSCNEFDI